MKSVIKMLLMAAALVAGALLGRYLFADGFTVSSMLIFAAACIALGWLFNLIDKKLTEKK